MKGFLWGVNVPKQLHCLKAVWSSCQAGTNLWPFRQMRECEIIVSFTGVVKSTFCSICMRERELWPDFHASTNSCLVYSVLFVLKHIIFTSIVWPFIFRNFIWLNCRNSNCVTLCAMLQSIRCHFQVWTFTCPFNRMNKNSTKKPSNKEIQSFTSVNLFGFLSYVSNTIN